MPKYQPVQLICKFCEKSWQVPYRARNSIYCSKACSNSGTKRRRTVKSCKSCHVKFEIIQSRDDSAKFCSLKCAYNNIYDRPDEPIIINCEGCTSKFEVSFIHRDKRFCSKSCANSGERNSFYGKKGLDHPTAGSLRWNYGLTIHTDERLRIAGEKISDIISQKLVDGTWNHTGFKTEWYESKKAGRIFLRSSYESTFARQLDADKNVLSFTSEPMRIPYTWEGSRKNYVPDFLVEYHNGSKEVIEVKPASLVNNEIVEAKKLAAEKFCKSLGVNYRVVTENDLNNSYGTEGINSCLL